MMRQLLLLTCQNAQNARTLSTESAYSAEPLVRNRSPSVYGHLAPLRLNHHPNGGLAMACATGFEAGWAGQSRMGWAHEGPGVGARPHLSKGEGGHNERVEADVLEGDELGHAGLALLHDHALDNVVEVDHRRERDREHARAKKHGEHRDEDRHPASRGGAQGDAVSPVAHSERAGARARGRE